MTVDKFKVTYFMHPGCPKAGILVDEVEADYYILEAFGNGKAVTFYIKVPPPPGGWWRTQAIASYSHVRSVTLCPPTNTDAEEDTNSKSNSESQTNP